ncbi:MAG: RNA 2',3'-cyclic phosphodiesterase [Flavobacteriales bacterium]|nr:RNA 2',3'-cyclic phosphodiesterase [Flavobacteriales bacterium]
MKLFTGIELPAEFITPFSVLKSRNKQLEGIRWSKPESFHITTYYIGDFSPARLSDILNILDKVARQNSVVQLEYKKLGFSPGKNPTMLWAYFKLNTRFQKLCNDISGSVNSDMPARYKPTPHVSIARLKKPHFYYQPDFEIEIPSTLTSNQLCLWESVGNKYKCIKKFELSN